MGAMSIEDLLGVRRLVAIYSEDSNGRRDYDFGEDAIRRLIYHADGYMNTFI